MIIVTTAEKKFASKRKNADDTRITRLLLHGPLHSSISEVLDLPCAIHIMKDKYNMINDWCKDDSKCVQTIH